MYWFSWVERMLALWWTEMTFGGVIYDSPTVRRVAAPVFRHNFNDTSISPTRRQRSSDLSLSNTACPTSEKADNIHKSAKGNKSLISPQLILADGRNFSLQSHVPSPRWKSFLTLKNTWDPPARSQKNSGSSRLPTASFKLCLFPLFWEIIVLFPGLSCLLRPFLFFSPAWSCWGCLIIGQLQNSQSYSSVAPGDWCAPSIMNVQKWHAIIQD